MYSCRSRGKWSTVGWNERCRDCKPPAATLQSQHTSNGKLLQRCALQSSCPHFTLLFASPSLRFIYWPADGVGRRRHEYRWLLQRKPWLTHAAVACWICRACCATMTSWLQIREKIKEIQDALEERDTLSKYNDPLSTGNDSDNDENDNNFFIIGLLKSIRKSLVDNYHEHQGKASESDVLNFQTLIDAYSDIYNKLDADITFSKDVSPYQLQKNDYILERNIPEITIKQQAIIEPIPVTSKKVRKSPLREQRDPNVLTHDSKSVRFKHELVELSPTRPFSPYKDNIDDISENNTQKSIKPYKDTLFELSNGTDDQYDDLDNPPIDLSNSKIFIHNQQQFKYQDDQLDQLHNSVKQQKQISMHINDEVNDQFVILNDLESGIDRSNARIIRTTNRLQKYRQALKKRGDWMCIIILTFVLLFLLIVVK